MNYLSDNIRCTVNGEETRLAIVVEDGHIVFFHRTPRSGVIGNIINTGAALALVTTGVVGASVALVGLAADAVIGKLKKPGLIATINKIKVKYKISADEVFISYPGKCSVKLSGKFSLLNSTCTVYIEGDFIAGETRNKYTIKTSFGERPGSIEKIFSRGNFPVSFSPLNQDSASQDFQKVDLTKITWCKNCVYFTDVEGWEDFKKGYWIASSMPTENYIPCTNLVTTGDVWEAFYHADQNKRTLYPKGCPHFTAKN